MRWRWDSAVYFAITVIAAGPISADAATIRIVAEGISFSPAEVTAKVGDTIEWSSKDVVLHTATDRNDAWDIKIPVKKSVTLVLKKAGSYAYYCRFHPNMTGTIQVTEP